MGFFSSRKAEDNDQYLTTTNSSDKSVVHVIRSRFVRSRPFPHYSVTNCFLAFTCSTGRTKEKIVRDSHALRLRHMARPWHIPFQSPPVPRLQNVLPPPRRARFLAGAGQLVPAFCAPSMTVRTFLRRRGLHPRQRITHWAQCLRRPRLGPEITHLRNSEVREPRQRLLAKLLIVSRTFLALIPYHARSTCGLPIG
jgi:hypothetical protein